MRITGTFLSSRIARRIALILFLAAFIPTVLITALTHKTIDNLLHFYSQQKLVDTSQNYALSAFSNLMFAKTSLLQLGASIKAESKLQEHLKNNSMFNSLLLIGEEGVIKDKSGPAEYYSTALFKRHIKSGFKDTIPETARLLVLPSGNNTNDPVIALVYPHANLGFTLLAEINPDYLWGDKTDYPSDIQVCAYRAIEATITRLFCSSEEHAPANVSASLYAGKWELFLRAEFQDEPWTFVTTRSFPVYADMDGFISNRAYVGAAFLILLLVALLSLVQIRRTMVPLERLMDGTRSISQGDFSPVQVDGHNEFSELALAFNHMSSHIKRQLNTLKSLSIIDREIISSLDVDRLTHTVITRTQQILPSAIISVFRLQEADAAQANCSVIASDNTTLPSSRLIIPRTEIDIIRTYKLGHFGNCKESNQFAHENLMASLGANYYWIFPIFWQDEMCAFICAGSAMPLSQDDAVWDEVQELAGRIGIAISAQQREDRLLVQAQYDSLTGLPNRILLQDRLQQAIEYSDRSEHPFWLAFMDIDRFKFINDSLGHTTGDLLLIEIAKRLSESIRDTDTAARFGGDEFIIILQGSMNENLRMGILHRLIHAIEEPVIISGNELVISCSVGISIYPADGSTPDMLLKNADMAMYRAKDLGRNNFQFFTESMNKKVAERLHIESHLRKAFVLNEFSLLYQPKVDLVTKQIVGVEALIRWNNKELGAVLPQNFIPLAEETGLIVSIGEWVIKTACVQAAAWHRAGFENLRMSVNLSARQFRQKDLPKSIENILDETGLNPRCLEIELTETVIMSEIESSIGILHAIKSLGIHLSVDDFGTGYSSLSYLKNLPLDTLKIDKSFIDDIHLSTDEAPIVASIISLAKNLKLNVIAEGVETEAQVAYLTGHGCNEMQGYYFSRPESVEALTTMLEMQKPLGNSENS